MSGIIIEAQKNLSTILLKTSSSDIIPRLLYPKKKRITSLRIFREHCITKQGVNNSPCNQSYPNQTEVNRTLLQPFTLTTLHHPAPHNFPLRGPNRAQLESNFNRRISQRVSSKDERAPASST